MSDTPNPFTEHVTKKPDVLPSVFTGWAVAVVMALLAGLFLLLWSAGRGRDTAELDSLRAKLAETTTNLNDALTENQTNQDLIANLKNQVADLEKEKELATQMANGLENEMRRDLESKDVTISQLQGKLTVNILDRVLFDSGEAVLKPAGQTVMQKIGDLLAKHPELKIHVIGHTDNIPIRPSAHGKFASNWELSTARALAAVHFLTESAGVDPRRVGAVGYGEYRPIADNATAEGRARNRRIAITILPEELAAADTAPAVRGVVATNILSIVQP